MLDVGNSREIVQQQWESLENRAELPGDAEQYWAKSGPMPVITDTQRRFNRHYLREIAVLRYQDSTLGVYTKDVSRMGFGFYSPIQLFPGDEVELNLPGRDPLNLHVARCKRLENKCYDCGANFSSFSDTEVSE